MNFIMSLTINDFILAFVGIIGIVGLVVSLRAMRKDRLNLDARYGAMNARIEQTAHSIRDYNKNLQSSEQLHIIAASLADALRQKNHSDQNIVKEFEDHISIDLGGDTLLIYYKSRPIHMQSAHEAMLNHKQFKGQYKRHGHGLNNRQAQLHGAGLWEVHKGHKIESFSNLIQLEKYILELINKEYFNDEDSSE